jgi:hypothetical protein
LTASEYSGPWMVSFQGLMFDPEHFQAVKTNQAILVHWTMIFFQ